jgi:hypothetical protein
MKFAHNRRWFGGRIHSTKLVFALVLGTFLGTFQTVLGAEGVDILPRDRWGAQPAIERRTPTITVVESGRKRVAAENVMPRREKARYLTVHHTGRLASSRPLQQNLASFQRQMFDYHIDYGPGRSKRIYLGDIPYHYFIDKEGRIGEGRELKYAAYSNTVYETPIEQHITVVLDGNFQIVWPTKAQIASLTDLLTHLAREHSIPTSRILVHSDLAQTLCPGQNLVQQIPAVKAALVERGIAP